MKIGLRTIKTSIAVTIGLFAVALLNLESPFFVTIAALIGMQATISDSWVVGRNRMLGTAVGAIFGMLLAIWLPPHPILAGIAVLLLIQLMNLIKTPEAVVISCIVFVAVFMEAGNGAVEYALSRLFDTGLGIGIALVVNYFLMPPTYDQQVLAEIRKEAPAIIKSQNRMLGVLMHQKYISVDELQEELDRIEEGQEEIKKLVELQEKEEKINVHGEMSMKEVMLVYKLISEMHQHLQNLMGIVEKGVALSIMQPMEKELASVYEALTDVEKDLDKGDDALSQRLEEIEARANEIKRKIKNQETAVPLSVEETVKLLVVLYNVEEILSKSSIIFSYSTVKNR
ncbi:Uncharacterized membrane protein YgaE, UPF0421/DUF939 family [Tindallia magadiensis]|uniref:Uncharacterized membrane protein YgaE, UPF0421/DUF939 family n=1 Tax=Tindallia magadiensis TaxID=69895 RepID=A0A1I3GG12_9FIRM|nr:aromatic acid exporter family protein [Tindallia magadiensis]SFI22374.1 Uncharacterized membrane protein YgaE, UPF0421/DUF939 family [Tindallia magadiensis]